MANLYVETLELVDNSGTKHRVEFYLRGSMNARLLTACFSDALCDCQSYEITHKMIVDRMSYTPDKLKPYTKQRNPLRAKEEAPFNIRFASTYQVRTVGGNIIKLNFTFATAETLYTIYNIMRNKRNKNVLGFQHYIRDKNTNVWGKIYVLPSAMTYFEEGKRIEDFLQTIGKGEPANVADTTVTADTTEATESVEEATGI